MNKNEKFRFQKLFRNTCRTRNLRQFIRFVAKKEYKLRPNAILHAIYEKSIPMVSYLIDNGCHPNLQNCLSLILTLNSSDRLLAWNLPLVLSSNYLGGDLFRNYPLDLPIGEPGESRNFYRRVICRILNATIHRGRDTHDRTVAKYSRFLRAVLHKNRAEASVLVKAGDYENYAGVLGDTCLPPLIALVFFDFNYVSRLFLHLGVGLTEIYLQAAAHGDLKVLEQCAKKPNFEARVRDSEGQNALHYACSNNQLDVIKVLIDKYELSLDWPLDGKGNCPLLCITDPETLRGVMAAYPETDINIKNINVSLSDMNCKFCEFYVTLLELGAKPTSHHYCCIQNKVCPVKTFLHKISLIHPACVDVVCESFKTEGNPEREMYKDEISKMKSIRLSQSTSLVPGKTLMDVISFTPNEAAKYSQNEVFLTIYNDNNQDFSKSFPTYGFELNRQMRRGMSRAKLLESCSDLLSEATGNGMLENFSEKIFESYTNQQLKNIHPRTPTETRNSLEKYRHYIFEYTESLFYT